MSGLFVLLLLIAGMAIGTVAGLLTIHLFRAANSSVKNMSSWPAQVFFSGLLAIVMAIITLALTHQNPNAWCLLLSPSVLPVLVMGYGRIRSDD